VDSSGKIEKTEKPIASCGFLRYKNAEALKELARFVPRPRINIMG